MKIGGKSRKKNLQIQTINQNKWQNAFFSLISNTHLIFPTLIKPILCKKSGRLLKSVVPTLQTLYYTKTISKERMDKFFFLANQDIFSLYTTIYQGFFPFPFFFSTLPFHLDIPLQSMSLMKQDMPKPLPSIFSPTPISFSFSSLTLIPLLYD